MAGKIFRMVTLSPTGDTGALVMGNFTGGSDVTLMLTDLNYVARKFGTPVTIEALKTGKVVLAVQYPSGTPHEFTWNEEAEGLEATFVTEVKPITEAAAGNLYVYILKVN